MPVGTETTERLDAASAATVRAALDRVLNSDVFRSAPQLSAFLSFIVERAIDGRSAELKGYTVAVEAFGRPPDFDPQSDPIVRVEAGRLRKALNQYYSGEGRGESVCITIPVGAYVPEFAFDHLREVPAAEQVLVENEPVNESVAARPSESALTRRRLVTLASLVPACGLAGLVTWRWNSSAGLRRHNQAQATPSGGALSDTLSDADALHLPVVAVALVDMLQDPASLAIARRVASSIVDALARFDDVVTVKAPGDAPASDDDVDYVLELSAATVGGMTERTARLRAVKGKRIVWSTSSTKPPNRDLNDPEWLTIARSIAVRLAEPFGVIHGDARRLGASRAMRCLFAAQDFRRTQKAEDHLAARTCLEAATKQDPTFHPAWSHLALLILEEYTSDLNPETGPPLDRALSAALTAVRLAPSSARAQQALMSVLFAWGQVDEALAAGRVAMSLNPYDPDVKAAIGARLIQLNRPGEGLVLLQQAIKLSRGHPPYYDFFAFLGSRLTGANKAADTYAAGLLADDGALSVLGRALHDTPKSDKSDIAKEIVRLKAASPLFRADARLYLERKGFGPEVTQSILSDLGPALSGPMPPR